MIPAIARRLLSSLIAVWGVMTLVFFAMYLQGDPVLLFVPENASEEIIEQFRRELGYDRPLIVQYFAFFADALRGDFGNSLIFQQPALTVVLAAVPATVDLAIAGLLVATVVGLAAGYASTRARNPIVRRIPLYFISIVQATPSFYLAVVAVLIFGVTLRVLPTGGSGSPLHLVMPAVCLGLFATPGIARVFRSSLLKVQSADFVRTARAKGALETRLATRHIVPNALLPVITILGMELGGMLGGAVIIETIFSWPGIGRLTIQSIFQRDYSVVLAIVTLLALAFVAINFIVDLLYIAIDPRVRVAGRRN